MNTKTKGLISETHIVARCLELGYSVLKPLGDNNRYDIVLEKDGVFSRVQCKTGREDNGCITFKTEGSMPLSNGGYVRKYYSKGDIDFVLVFYPVTKKVYKIPVGELCKGNGTLRLTQTKNGQVKKVKLAQDYEF